MRKIRQGARFRKDFKREMRGQHRAVLAATFNTIIYALANNQTLPVALKDHALIGDRKGCRDCHIRPDLVLIYRKIGDDALELVRIGSHSELEFD